MRRSAILRPSIKCELIPNCSVCKLGTECGVKCDVTIPEYIPDKQIDRILQKFKDKYHK